MPYTAKMETINTLASNKKFLEVADKNALPRPQ